MNICILSGVFLWYEQQRNQSPPFNRGESSAGSGPVLVLVWSMFNLQRNGLLSQSLYTPPVSQHCSEQLWQTTSPLYKCCSWLCMPTLASKNDRSSDHWFGIQSYVSSPVYKSEHATQAIVLKNGCSSFSWSLITITLRWRKQFFILDQQSVGGSLEPVILTESQFFG